MITIYSTKTCPRCSLLKDAFQKANIVYVEKPLDSAIIADVLCETGILAQAAPLVRAGAVYFFADDFFDTSGNLLSNWHQVLEGIEPHEAEFAGHATNETKEQSCNAIWGNR